MSKSIYKLAPIFKGKPWGYEKWILCCHKEGESIVQNDDVQNKSLWSHLDYKPFPLMIKIIRAEENLSIQVHPDDLYAKEVENDTGKNEFWYIIDAKQDAAVYCGLKEKMDKEQLKDILKQGTIENYLNKIEVKAGDYIYIPSGVIHAIGRNVTLLEVQKNSNITYRIYDYNRGRQLDLQKALDVVDMRKNIHVEKKEDFKFFTSENFIIKKERLDVIASYFNRDNFEVVYIKQGVGVIYSHEEQIEVCSGDTIYIEKGTFYNIQGDMDYFHIICK
ncbi:mannose-6-phosphate isomerase [Hathewaya proteolytica DSM 3090]|uniref:Mannose-6-phosphate isomerase n=1 Tax=Hathewaya proteolytica DSM 3090 TaxID=1121331 RepID=A0A1M6RMN9_9CLOT|nr:type I phosphomannose isomerase catalytic subunit [Hathewaya proteolytica]SHK33660.1 mannose-6-phosphate isomerase [Hathewaya proteolytica DSM 3090]